jgi:hypothetical protein
VELGDETTTPEKDPRRPAMRSAPAAAVSNSARRFACAAMTCEERREVSGSDPTHRGEMTVASDAIVGAPTAFNPRAENAAVTGGGQVGGQCQQVGPVSASVPLTGGPRCNCFPTQK